MSGLEKLIEWIDDNKAIKPSIELIKLQAHIFSLEEKYSLEHFQAVQQQVFNPKKVK
jgi:hypothetical protein